MKSVTLKKIVLIGASTGGPGQIEKIVSSLPTLKHASVIIAQHMVEGFLESFASRLQCDTKNNISIIKNKQRLESGFIYIAEGITNLDTNKFIFQQKPSSGNTYNPDIDTLFHSFLPLTKDIEILPIILTGIGSDGVKACIELSKNGVNCVTESANSAIVDGMPNRARTLVPRIQVSEMDTIVKMISEFCDV